MIKIFEENILDLVDVWKCSDMKIQLLTLYLKINIMFSNIICISLIYLILKKLLFM